jgi:acetate kinase
VPLTVLALNSGSSSLKFALYECGAANGQETRLLSGNIDRIGSDEPSATITESNGAVTRSSPRLARPDAAVDWLIAELKQRDRWQRVQAVGHRIVHGGDRYQAPVRITPEVLRALSSLVPLAPEHLPRELEALDAVSQRAPDLPQIACFDTAFHTTLPPVARVFGLPRSLLNEGVRRYGFHGLSYEFIVSELHSAGPLPRRLIVAHLGNGASAAAILEGRSIDTSMGFTPAGGFIMGTRSGDLDPGVLLYLLREKGYSLADLSSAVTHRGGLLGVSETSADMRTLLARYDTDSHAAEAVDIFCYQVRQCIGAFAATLAGLDALVFTGGIGEHAATVRARIADGLEHLGIHLDAERNTAGDRSISVAGAPVAVHVIATDEEKMIARHCRALCDPP